MIYEGWQNGFDVGRKRTTQTIPHAMVHASLHLHGLITMPITPFHFGPGALLAALAPGAVSWTVFALANVLIDLEPITLFFLTGDPAHPWLHTPPGALGVAILTVLLGRRPCEAFLRGWNTRLSPAQARWLAVDPVITAVQAWTGAVLGTSTHILLDAVMHVDVRPFWPFLAGNPLQAVLGMDFLHGACVAAGVAGIGILLGLSAGVRRAD